MRAAASCILTPRRRRLPSGPGSSMMGSSGTRAPITLARVTGREIPRSRRASPAAASAAGGCDDAVGASAAAPINSAATACRLSPRLLFRTPRPSPAGAATGAPMVVAAGSLTSAAALTRGASSWVSHNFPVMDMRTAKRGAVMIMDSTAVVRITSARSVISWTKASLLTYSGLRSFTLLFTKSSAWVASAACTVAFGHHVTMVKHFSLKVHSRRGMAEIQVAMLRPTNPIRTVRNPNPMIFPSNLLWSTDAPNKVKSMMLPTLDQRYPMMEETAAVLSSPVSARFRCWTVAPNVSTASVPPPPCPILLKPNSSAIATKNISKNLFQAFPAAVQE
mmetsp:Transcript_29967/g.65870  ORF Transcript_29967/g.65870 Transcript_29967/m.65870 type:complete len:335 (-) Transcript_29967:884-1888(-)